MGNHAQITDPSSPYYNDPMGFAEHHYAFYQCYECKKPYFGGAKECGPADEEEEVDRKELLCGKCQNVESVDQCGEHGSEYLTYKCRYCCAVSVFHCWGRVHFCHDCHTPGVWDKLSTYSTGKNKKNIEDYPQCPAIQAEIDKLRSSADWPRMGRDEKDVLMLGMRSDPETCPLRTKHPPNGFEFGLGCTLCADKKAEIENEKVRKRIEKEMKEKLKELMNFMDNVPSGTRFVHQYPMDENGILYFFGSHGKTKPWQNPADQGMCIVTTCEMMPDSAPCNALCGREALRCVTKPSANCWFAVDLVDKFVKPSNYTLRHYISWDTECLRNWVVEGSIDGERWLVIRQHQNDQALNFKGLLDFFFYFYFFFFFFFVFFKL